MTADYALELDNLGISFGALRAVSDLSLQVASGSITSVIGPNGAGKSTLFNLISGSLRPRTGRVRLHGQDITGLRAYEIARRGLGRSFQITNLFADMSVWKNLLIAAQVLENPSHYVRDERVSTRAAAMAENLLDRFALASRRDELAGNLSHGEQRRLEIAVAMAAEPKVLLLDEPTQGMAHADTAETARLIRALAREMTVLLIEHDVGLVMDISDHVMVMHLGQKLAEGTPAQIRADRRVQDAYLGRG